MCRSGRWPAHAPLPEGHRAMAGAPPIRARAGADRDSAVPPFGSVKVNTRHARVDVREYLMRDGVGPSSQLLDTNARSAAFPGLAEQHHLIAIVGSAPGTNIRHDLIHADAAHDRNAPAAHDHLRAAA